MYKYFIAIMLFLISCNKHEGPGFEIIETYNFSVTGNGQRNMAGSYFDDSVKVYASGNIRKEMVRGMRAVFKVVSGGGAVDISEANVVNGYAATRWKSGNSSCFQKLRAEIYDKDNKLINTLHINNLAFRTGVWDTIYSEPEIRFWDVWGDTISGKTFAIGNNNMYTQGSNFFTWDIVMEQINGFSFHSDAAGMLYMSTWYGKIFKSGNGGNSWQLCENPIIGHPYFYYMAVTNDGYMWASTYHYPHSLRCSRDGGITWTADTIGLSPGSLVADVHRLKNGDILLYDFTSFYRSTDDGRTWKPLNVPQYSTKLFVTDNNEVIVISLGGGANIYKSVDGGKSFSLKHTVPVDYHTSMQKNIRKYKNTYYVLIPGYGVLKTTNFESFEPLYRNLDIRFLYMAHDGLIICRGLDNQKAYFYKIPN
jgi:hypothetical protein